MSADDSFLLSSPISVTGRRRRSKFTYKQFAQLEQYSVSTPLRVIALVDLDAFYAQCESVRLDLPEKQPLAVQQWSGLIAVNYPARAKGISRFLDIGEAKKLCPDIVLQHVATWKEGDEKWQYHSGAFDHIASHKVSLDPYRSRSKQILACIKESLPSGHLQRVEKASIDEVFLDLSAQVHSIMLERYPELKGPPPYDDPTENLPRPPTTALDWAADSLVDLDESHTEDDDPDWDDIVMCIASEIVRGVRARIREVLKFTCSAGIARNKMLAKLGSAYKKPNNQTIIRNRAVQQFLHDFKFTKIRNLGGKLGDQVVATFGTEQVNELLKVPIEQLKLKLGDDTGSWLYTVIRGEEQSEVNPRTQIKSMLSAKSFPKPINSLDQAERWLRIFVADIFSRLVEEGVLENKRRPKTMTLHHRQGGQTWSRQLPIPQGRVITEQGLFELSKQLMQQIILEGRVWPCANLSLAVGGFEEGLTGNRSIGGFLLKGEEAQALNTNRMQTSDRATPVENHPAKRRKTDTQDLDHFFKRNVEKTKHDVGAVPPVYGHTAGHTAANDLISGAADHEDEGLFVPEEVEIEQPAHTDNAPNLELWTCPKCHEQMVALGRDEHQDWHFAKDLQASEGRSQAAPAAAVKNNSSTNGKTSKAKTKGPEKGQMKLVFKG